MVVSYVAERNNIAKEIAKCHDQCVFDKKVNIQKKKT